MKSSNEQSLRFLVEKWLAPSPTMPVHVTAFSRTPWVRRRYVRVETALPVGGSLALFFFRHDDGCWCVFPPTDDRLKRIAGRSALG